MYTAKHHLRIGKKSFRPGDEIPPELMSDEVWKRLYTKGAITGTPDPVEALLEEEGETPHQPPRAAASPQGEANGTEEPVINPQYAMLENETHVAEEQQVEELKAGSKKASGKKASGSYAKAATEKEPELPLIDAGAMVVEKPKGKKGA